LQIYKLFSQMANKNSTIGEKIRKIRKDLNLSQSIFSEKLNISTAYLSEIENGRKDITTKIIQALKKEFNISSDWLLFANSEMNVNENEKKEELIGNDINISYNSSDFLETSLGKKAMILLNQWNIEENIQCIDSFAHLHNMKAEKKLFYLIKEQVNFDRLNDIFINTDYEKLSPKFIDTFMLVLNELDIAIKSDLTRIILLYLKNNGININVYEKK